MKRALLLAGLATQLIVPSAFAQEGPGDAEPGEFVSRYWLREPLILGATVGLPNHVFTINSGQGTGTERNIDFAPPQTTDLTLTLGYGFFIFSYKLPLPQSGSSRSTYGDVAYKDMALEFGHNRWAGSLYYQTFAGFYTDLNGHTGNYARIGDSGSSSNSTDTSEIEPSQNILRRSDIHTKHYGLIAWHAIPLVGENNQAFSLTFNGLIGKPESGFNLDSVQSVFYDRAQVNGATPFVPAAKAASYGKGAQLQGVDMYSAGAGLGLVSSYVFGRQSWSVDSLFLYGGGAQRQQAQFEADQTWKTAYVNNVNFRFGVNYWGERSFAGLHFRANTMAAKVSNVNFNSSSMSLEMNYVGAI